SHQNCFPAFHCRFSFLTFKKPLANDGPKKQLLRRLQKSYPSIQMAKKRREKKNRENKEENLCNSRRRRRGSGESEDCGDQGDDKKRQGPPQHFASSGKNLSSFEGIIGRACNCQAISGAIPVPFSEKSRIPFYLCTMCRGTIQMRCGDDFD